MSESSFGADWDVSPLHSRDPNPRSQPAPPNVPERLGDHRVLGVIGSGGMGLVLRGYHPVLESEVAIKILRRAPFPPGEKELERFRREALATARLRHPHIVGVHTVGVYEGLPYLVMDLVRGESLSEHLKRVGPVEPRRAAEVALGLAEALEHAHSRHVVHRDVKPSNVFLTPEGQPLLGDFGLARVLDLSRQGLTGTRDVLGTPGYMAPEQAQGGQADARSDVYALGATVYAMLSGVPPHQASTLLAFLDQLNRRPARPLRELRREVPPDLAWIVMRCLERDPAARYPSAAALAADLRRHLDGQRVRPGGAWASRLGVALATGLLVVGGALLARAVISPSRVAPRATQVVDQAERALEAERFEEARSLCDQLLSAEPGHEQGLRLRSRALEALGELDAAERDLSAILAVREQEAGSWLRRAHLRQRLGRLHDALEDYTRAIELGEPCWAERGLLLKRLNRDLAAAEDLERAIRLAPDDAALWRELAWARGVAQDYAGAGEALDQAARLEPDHVDVWLIRGQLAARGDPREALRCYDRAIELDGSRAQLYLDRAQLRRSVQDWEGMVADTTRAIELAPERSDAWNNRASAYYELRDWRRSLDDYQRAIELAPDEPLLLSHRGMVWAHLGELPRGFQDIERALALQPDLPQALLAKGHMLAMDGRLEESLRVGRRVIEAPGMRLQGLALVGEVLAAEQRWREAIVVYDQLLGSWPDDPQGLFMRGMALANTGRRSEAVLDLQRFVDRVGPADPRKARAQQALQGLREELGR